MERLTSYELGAAFFAQIPTYAQEAVIEFARTAGSTAAAEARAFHEQHITGRPLMDCIVLDEPKYMFASIAGASAWMDDAISADWSVEKYKALYMRFGISEGLAQQMAEDTYTADSGPLDMVTKLIRMIPDLPGEWDDGAKSVISKVIHTLGGGLANSLTMRKEDNLWEMMRCGEKLQELRRRMRYKLRGDALAIPAPGETPYPVNAEGKADLSWLGQLAGAVLPIVLTIITRGRASGGGGAGLLGQGGKVAGLLSGDVAPGEADEAGGPADDRLLVHADNLARIVRSPYHGGDLEQIGDAIAALTECAPELSAEQGDFLSDAASFIGNITTGNYGAALGTAAKAVGGLIGKKQAAQPAAGPSRSARPAGAAPGPDLSKAIALLNRLRTDLNTHAHTSRYEHRAIMTALRNSQGSVSAFLRQLGVQPRLVGPMTPSVQSPGLPQAHELGPGREGSHEGLTLPAIDNI